MFNLKFTTDNAAFCAGFDCADDNDQAAVNDRAAELETARILRQVAARVERGDGIGIVMDANGNRIGRFSLELE